MKRVAILGDRGCPSLVTLDRVRIAKHLQKGRTRIERFERRVGSGTN
jgi:hypothetical protein